MFLLIKCHNPYFNRWFSAIKFGKNMSLYLKEVTILILIDGFLQSDAEVNEYYFNPESQSLF